ncbi:MAG: hypothetical protein L6282_06220 [Candidatus Methanoperedenaceae archaeon]|nr:hypothetical protein [Candidatus Methanoperedenaceae archaeon]
MLPPPPHLTLSPAPLLLFSPLATATVSPNSSWYRPNPNTYQNTTVITIDRARTNITLKFNNGSIMVSNATQTSVDATSAADQSYILFNNTVLGYANRDVNFTVDGVIYANRTADASGFVSFNYTKFIASGSSHVFKWVVNTSNYDVNNDGVVDIYDLILVGNNPDQSIPLPYPDYDVDGNGKVDLNDYLDVLFYLKNLNI